MSKRAKSLDEEVKVKRVKQDEAAIAEASSHESFQVKDCRENSNDSPVAPSQIPQPDSLFTDDGINKQSFHNKMNDDDDCLILSIENDDDVINEEDTDNVSQEIDSNDNLDDRTDNDIYEITVSKLSEAQCIVDKQKAKIQKLQREKHEEMMNRINSQSEILDYKKELDAVTSKLHETLCALEKEKKEAEMMQNKIKELQDREEEREDFIRRLHDIVCVLVDLKDADKKKLEELQDRLNIFLYLSGLKASLKQELDSVINTLEEAFGTINGPKEEMQDPHTECSSLKNKITDLINIKKVLQEKINSQESQTDDLDDSSNIEVIDLTEEENTNVLKIDNLGNRILEATKVIEDQVDAAIQKLDNLEDEDLAALQRKRAAALKKELKQKEEWIANGHGEYSTLTSEKEFFDASKKSKNVVVHCYRTSTMRCAIVDKHLSALATKHVETKFCKLDVEKAPFLCERLKIRVIPTILLCKETKIDFIVGFDELGGVDDFSTEMMEWRLAKSGVINYEGDLYTPPDSEAGRSQRSFIKRVDKTIRGGTNDSDSDE